VGVAVREPPVQQPGSLSPLDALTMLSIAAFTLMRSVTLE
jgi:hypothetical protein